MNNVLSYNQKINQTERVSSLYTPFIAIETERICGRRLVSGSADVYDGTQILLSLLNTNSQSIHSVDAIPRFRFKKNNIGTEYSYQNDEFIKSGYSISPAPLPYPTVNIIQKVEDYSIAFSDSRGIGQSITI